MVRDRSITHSDETRRRARVQHAGAGPADARPPWQFHGSRRSHLLHRLGAWSARASAGVAGAAVLVTWGVLGMFVGFPHWWEVVLYSTTSAVTVVMLFAIQHIQHREQVVTQRKLDELLRAHPRADDRMIAAEVADDEELLELIAMGTDEVPDAPANDDDASGRR